ncbi:MAG: hypothetical protein ABJ314_07775, partial [Ilumatobacter sp.]
MIHRTSSTNSAIRKFIPLTVAATLTVAACGTGSDESSADSEDTCRTAQRLVDDAADLDDDGIDRQFDRLADIDGIDDLTDLDEVDDLVRDADEDALDDVVDLLNDDLDCDLDIPTLASVETVPDTEPTVSTETVPPAPSAPSTPATTEEPVDTEPATTEPEATTPEDSAPEPPETAEPGAAGTVEIGATGPGLDIPDLITSAPDAVAESGITQIPVPAGDVGVLEYDVRYDVDTFADAPEYSASESFTFVAATPMAIDDVRIAFVDAISANGDYDVTDSTSTQDTTSTTSTSLDPVDFGEAPQFDVFVTSDTEVPGVVLIEIDLFESRDGELPAYIAPAEENFATAQDIGETAGWTVRGWRWAPGVNQFSGDAFTSGGIDWTAGTGTAADVAAISAELLPQLPAPDFEDVT